MPPVKIKNSSSSRGLIATFCLLCLLMLIASLDCSILGASAAGQTRSYQPEVRGSGWGELAAKSNEIDIDYGSGEEEGGGGSGQATYFKGGQAKLEANGDSFPGDRPAGGGEKNLVEGKQSKFKERPRQRPSAGGSIGGPGAISAGSNFTPLETLKATSGRRQSVDNEIDVSAHEDQEPEREIDEEPEQEEAEEDEEDYQEEDDFREADYAQDDDEDKEQEEELGEEIPERKGELEPRGHHQKAASGFLQRDEAPSGDKSEEETRKRNFSAGQRQLKARQRRKFKRLNELRTAAAVVSEQSKQLQPPVSGSSLLLQNATEAPILNPTYRGRVTENERLVELTPKLRILNQVEVCDMELFPLNNNQSLLPFIISWLDRVQGEASLEARKEELMDCETQRNYTFKLRAIGCNGLQSNEALVSISVEDINEFGPHFQRHLYSLSLDLEGLVDRRGRKEEDEELDGDQQEEDEDGFVELLQVKAYDADCSAPFNSICRYELLSGAELLLGEQAPGDSPSSPERPLAPLPAKLLRLGPGGRVKLDPGGLLEELRKLAQPEVAAAAKANSVRFQVIAFDCAGKKSPRPAEVRLSLSKQCRPGLRDVDTQINYKPGSGDRSPFSRASFHLCGAKCHRPNVTVELELDGSGAITKGTSNVRGRRLPAQARAPSQLPVTKFANKQTFHCDRDSYSMVSKRRLCGSRARTIELLPAYSQQNKWISALHQASGNKQLRRPSSPAAAGSGPDELELPASDERPERPESAPEVEAEHANEDEDLAAYSLEGSYGRHAISQLELFGSDFGGLQFASLEQERQNYKNKTQKRTNKHNNQQQRKRTDQVKRNTRELAKEQQASTSGERLKRKLKHLDPTSIYRDQVYRFDGLSSGLIIPRTVYQQNLETNSSSNSESGSAPNFLFGSNHSLSFWMRHGPFEFPRSSELKSGNGSVKSEEQLEELERHVKEHLLCASRLVEEPKVTSGGSSSLKGRRQQLHYALFVRNCKLVLLMRRQKEEREDSTRSYKPAVWRWSLNQNKACDQKWHLYTIRVNHFNVELYVDGQQFVEGYNNLLVLDDLPLEPIRSQQTGSELGIEREDHDVSEGAGEERLNLEPEMEQNREILSVGACWDSQRREMFGHFRGALSGLNVLPNELDDPRLVECLGQCSEQLQLASQTPKLDSQSMLRDQRHEEAGGWPEVERNKERKLDNSLVSFQESQTKLTLAGHDLLDLEEALAQVAYVNSRPLPSIGRRLIQAQVKIECQNPPPPSVGLSTGAGSQVQVSPTTITHASTFEQRLQVEVNVLASKTLPLISIVGMENIAREYPAFVQGIRLFSFVSLQLKRISLLQERKHHLATRQQQQPLFMNKSLEDSDYVEDGNMQQFPEVEQANGNSLDKIQVELGELSNVKRKIEACNVRVYPPLNNLHETIQLPLEQMQLLGLYWKQSHEGFIIYGLDSGENYEKLLRLIVYKNQKPAYYTERVFKLTCSDMNGRLVSNEYSQTVTIIHNSDKLTSQNDQQQLVVVLQPAVPGPQVAHLKQAEVPQVSSGGFGHHSPETGSGRRHSNEFTLLELEQPFSGGSQMDRIATAILVFVFSLIVLMVVIALINLRDSWTRSSSKNGSRNPQISSSNKLYGHKQMADGSLHALSFDIDSPRSHYYYCSNQSCDLLCESRELDGATSFSDDEQPEEEEDEEYYEEGEPQATIVMNPILHNQQRTCSDRLPAGGKFLPRTFVTEQRPNRAGAMTKPARTILTHHLPELTLAGSGRQRNDLIPIDEQDFSSNSDESDDNETGSRFCDKQRKPRARLINNAAVYANSEEEEEAEEDNLSSTSADHYEIYHHHHHHACLKDLEGSPRCPHALPEFQEPSCSGSSDSDQDEEEERR